MSRTVDHVTRSCGAVVWASLVFATTVSVATSVQTPALAQETRRQSAQQQATKVPQAVSTVVLTPHPSPLLAVVSIKRQRIDVFDKNGVVVSSPVSTGRKDFETPQGAFTIIEKKEEHISNLYDDASMPFMQRITWSGVALHEGNLPGYPASHGCIRLPSGFAERLFKITRMNTRIVVVPDETAPMSISHPTLFQPRLTPTVPSEPHAAPPQLGESQSADSPMMLGARLPRPAGSASVEVLRPQNTVTSPIEAARMKRAAAADKVALAVKAANEAKAAVKINLGLQAKALREFKAGEVQLRRTTGRLDWATRGLANAKTETAIAKAETLKTKTEEEVEVQRQRLEELRATLEQRTATVTTLSAAAKEHEGFRAAAEKEARDAGRLVEPISVFISRRAGKLYIRQARYPIAEFPVTFRDPNRVLGTHVFTAMDTNAHGGVSWSFVTIEGPEAPISAPIKLKKGEKANQTVPRNDKPYAMAALDQVQIPQDALERILPYVQAGSSLLISDLGPSIETGPHTDFVVQTKGEEQAAANIAKFIADKKAEEAEKRRGIYRQNTAPAQTGPTSERRTQSRTAARGEFQDQWPSPSASRLRRNPSQ